MKTIKTAALLLAAFTLFTGCGNSAKTTEANVESFQVETQSEKTDDHVLIAYFSRIGNIDSEHEVDAISSASVVTQGDELLGNMEYMAKLIQDVAGGDIHFIETSEPYPSEYDSSDNNAIDVQVDKEHRENARPELATHIDNIDIYDTVFLGFPCWYGDMPMAVYSFLDEYDLSGKKIYLFYSSGGSGARNVYEEVLKLEPDADAEKNIFSVSHSQVSGLTSQDMQKWLSEIGYDN